MTANNGLTILLASPEPALLAAVEPVLLGMGARVEIVLTAQAALAAMTGECAPGLALLDAALPEIPMGQLLAAVRAEAGGRRFPIVLISDSVTDEWASGVAEGVIDDVILHDTPLAYLRLRLDLVMRKESVACELETLRNEAALDAQVDRLTGVYHREALLATLFRETDRAQRMKSSLCLVLLDIDDFGHWNSRLGGKACDELLVQVAARSGRLLRSYDVLGRPGMDEFLAVLPGCTMSNAVMLAERLRMDVFSAPFHVEGESIRLSACFGLAVSNGRSPVVVLREAEEALKRAKEAGPETIECFGESEGSYPAPVRFLSPGSGDELLAW
jgi:two-component system, cell cycle response regulator